MEPQILQQQITFMTQPTSIETTQSLVKAEADERTEIEILKPI